MNEDKIVDASAKSIEKASTAAVDSMKQEAKDFGFESPFNEEDGKEIITAKTDEKKSDKQDEKSKIDDEKSKIDDKTSRQSRAPLREVRERMREGLEKKFEEKYGTEINSLKTKIDQLEKGNLTKTETVDLKESIKNLSKELNIEEGQLEKIIGVARTGIVDELNTVKGKLAEYEKKSSEKSDDDIIAEQEEIFDGEWSDVVGAISEKFPNATKDQIEAARVQMDELAHSEKYSEYDLDYILFKESAIFEKTLFSPKNRGFEDSSTAESDGDAEESSDPFSKPFKPNSYKDLEKMDRNTKRFEETLPDTRFTIN